MSNKSIVHIVSISAIFALLASFFFGDAGRIATAAFMAIIASVSVIFIKKRTTPSYLHSEVTMLMGVIAVVFAMLYYLTGLKFGFARARYGTFLFVIFRYVLPISVIVVSSELMRSVLRAQENKLVNILSYLSCVIAEVSVYYVWSDILGFKKFVDIIALALLPAIVSNLLYHYLVKRYGVKPNIIYRLIIALHPYIISYKTGIHNSLLAFVRLILPLAIYLFFNAFYEKKQRKALKNTSRIWRYTSRALAAIMLCLMLGVVMLVSNRFTYGSLVIATGSMTGEIDKGDVIIFEKNGDIQPTIGQVIVFHKNNTDVVHRIVDIKFIDGVTQYYTKGDANDENDSGFITDANIVGFVRYKLPNLGHPTLWIRSLFNR